MFYVQEITTAKSTTSTTRIKTWGGVITRISVNFPAGCQGLVEVRILHGVHQIAPANPDGYFASEEETIDFQEYYELEGVGNTLTITAKNNDDTLEHMVRVRILLLPVWLANPHYMLSGIASRLSRLLRRIWVT